LLEFFLNKFQVAKVLPLEGSFLKYSTVRPV